MVVVCGQLMSAGESAVWEAVFKDQRLEEIKLEASKMMQASIAAGMCLLSLPWPINNKACLGNSANGRLSGNYIANPSPMALSGCRAFCIPLSNGRFQCSNCSRDYANANICNRHLNSHNI